MMSPLQFVRRWVTTMLAWGLVAYAAVACGVYLAPALAFGAWAGVAVLLCGIGALLLWSQPMGKSTIGGRIGYQVVHFGFRASQGKLVGAALISWGVWLVVGSGVIWMTQGRWQPLRTAMALTWMIDLLALFYLWGITLRNRPRAGAPDGVRMRMPLPLIKLSGGIVALVVVSAVLWWVMGTPAAQLAALLIAAGPLVVVGGGYGLFFVVMMTAGKHARWN